MKTKKNFWKVLYFTVVLIIWGVTAGNPCFSKEIKKVAVLPFVMNTQQDLMFLQKGIFDMFSSRISYGDEVEVLTRENLENKLGSADLSSIIKGVNESKAKELGNFLNVDYVLFGSLTLFGNSMSLDVNMVDIRPDNPSLTFFRQGNEAGAVIPELDKIAEEINYKVFGRETLEFQSQQALQRTYSREGESYASPLKKFKALLTVDGIMNGVATGDLDGDKKNEIVVVQDRIVQIFKYAFNGKISLVQKIEDTSVSTRIVGVDVADINQNGFSEIFITRINNNHQSVASCVIEYNGSKYVKGKTTYPWYLRVIKDAKGNSELFAQAHTTKGPWLSNDVFKVVWQNNSYVQGTRLRVPEKGFSVLSMTSGKAVSNDTAMYLYTDELGQLVVFNDSGSIEWSSDKGYGGSSLFYTFPQKTADELYDKEYAFLQPKTITYDRNSDGKAELFVIKNKEASDYFFKNTRVFKKGSIEIFNWNEMGLTSENAPKKLSGPVTSIDIGDYDNDLKNELLVTMIKKSDNMFSRDSKSLLVAYDLD
ncbi:FG-GAP-like repeat-containing protein [Desulfobacula sp.]|uniref:FG-GAP-like repeat-containing protein n=1 Tax=Desulfobacula sp. TaxID=2593537 RepID=UPI0025B92073|nr:FG-GAP-like repeat-containing protein [Desulfobacula sp.]MBC2703852.1 VCBS repeat-containing protein [Desulfobacula sp.]